MLVHEYLERSARELPDKTALICGQERFTYRELDEISNRLAHSLIENGFEKGGRAAVFLDNSLEAVAGLFGVLKAGGVFLTVNPSMKSEKLSYILNNCRASVIMGHASKAPVISESADKAPYLKNIFLTGGKAEGLPGKPAHSLDGIINASGNPSIPKRSIDADLANIIYTSGSTGQPKGVMMAHYNMTSAADSITQYLENVQDDIILNTLPVSFDYGLYQVLMAFKTGATVILEKGFLYPYKVLEKLIDEQVTGFPVVPTMAAILAQMEDIKKMDFPALRYISNTAAALPVAHIGKLREMFPSARLFSMYGLTECKRVSYLPPEELDKRPSSVGKAMPNTEAYIVDEQGGRVGPGIIGELVVRGRNVMRGYWEMPEETAKKLRQDKDFPGELVLYTGDLFRSDDEGFLYFVSRMDDIIKSRGEKVSPKEIENVLYTMPGVIEAAVVGVEDPVFGQVIKAFVVAGKGASIGERDVLRFCSKHLEDHMVPKVVDFVCALPKTDTGKIKKAGLA